MKLIRNIRKNRKGSATIEAVVSFTGFLFVVFTLLNIVNFCRAQMLVSNAVDTVAKELSQYSYFYQISGLDKFGDEIKTIGKEGEANLNSVASTVGKLYTSMGEAVTGSKDQIQGLINEVEDGTINSSDITVAINTTKSSANTIVTDIEAMDAKFAHVGDNPVLYMQSVVAVAGSESLDFIKSHLIAAPLAKALVVKHFGENRDEADAALERLGIVDGLDGISFGLSTMFADGTDDDVIITACYKLKVMQLFKWADFEADICKNARVRAWLGGDDVQALAKVPDDLSFLEGPSEGEGGDAGEAGGGEEGGESGGEEGGDAGEEGDSGDEGEGDRSNLGEDGEGGDAGDTGEGETGGDDELPEPEDLLAGVGDLDIDTEELIATGFAGIVVVREQNEGKSQEEQLEELKEVIKFLNEDEDYNNQGGITEEEVNILREWAADCGADLDDLGLILPIIPNKDNKEEKIQDIQALIDQLKEDYPNGIPEELIDVIKTIAEESGVDFEELEFESGTVTKVTPSRLADNVLDADFLKNANTVKDKLPTWAKNKGNFGYSEVDIDGLDNTQFFAHSSIQTEIPSVKDSGISIKPESSPFKTVEVNGSNVINGEGAWPRDVDTEYKILSDIQSKLGDNPSASGKIKLYTELEPCPSCQSVIEQFKEMYPNIDIEVIYSVNK